MIDVSNLTLYAYRYLMSAISPEEQEAARVSYRAPVPVIQGLVEEKLLGRDEVWTTGYVFRGSEDELPVDMSNRGTGCVLLSHGGFWSQANRYNTSKFLTLTVSIFADSDRDKAGNVYGSRNAGEKALRIWQRIDPLFNDPTNRIHSFDTLPVVSCFQLGPPEFDDVPQSDGLIRVSTSYELVV